MMLNTRFYIFICTVTLYIVSCTSSGEWNESRSDQTQISSELIAITYLMETLIKKDEFLLANDSLNFFLGERTNFIQIKKSKEIFINPCNTLLAAPINSSNFTHEEQNDSIGALIKSLSLDFDNKQDLSLELEFDTLYQLIPIYHRISELYLTVKNNLGNQSIEKVDIQLCKFKEDSRDTNETITYQFSFFINKATNSVIYWDFHLADFMHEIDDVCHPCLGEQDSAYQYKQINNK